MSLRRPSLAWFALRAPGQHCFLLLLRARKALKFDGRSCLLKVLLLPLKEQQTQALPASCYVSIDISVRDMFTD